MDVFMYIYNLNIATDNLNDFHCSPLARVGPTFKASQGNVNCALIV